MLSGFERFIEERDACRRDAEVASLEVAIVLMDGTIDWWPPVAVPLVPRLAGLTKVPSMRRRVPVLFPVWAE